MRTDQFDFDLPEDRIALRPATPRDGARLLVVDPSGGLADRHVHDLPSLLKPGDALVFNDTRVVPGALVGERTRNGNTARVSVTLIKRLNDSTWRAFARPQKRLEVGDRIRFGDEGRVCFAGVLDASVAALGEAGEVDLAFNRHGPYLDEVVDAIGDMPLPPYIASRRAADDDDRQSYQTVYARKEGAVAAPTAGLHFTDELLGALRARDISCHFATLHVGPGTFLPVKTDEIESHRMQAEWGEVSPATADALQSVRDGGGRLVAVGSTSLRLVETAARASGRIEPFSGETDLFITPGYSFRAVDALMTNFHLPRSTLFMLVAAFSGLATMRQAYEHAIASGYRFYSYGDASLLFRQ
jgi:S-adenosylmethionine:tRNA ribosyltransferase-isomerase